MLKAEVRGEVPWSDVKHAERRLRRIDAELDLEHRKMRERGGIEWRPPDKKSPWDYV